METGILNPSLLFFNFILDYEVLQMFFMVACICYLRGVQPGVGVVVTRSTFHRTHNRPGHGFADPSCVVHFLCRNRETNVSKISPAFLIIFAFNADSFIVFVTSLGKCLEICFCSYCQNEMPPLKLIVY